MRLWRDCDLDMLVCSSFAARFSAYNPIEHLLSPLSKRLTSVRLSAGDGEDEHAPCRIGGLSTEEKQTKEALVFDCAMQEVCLSFTLQRCFLQFISSDDCSYSLHI